MAPYAGFCFVFLLHYCQSFPIMTNIAQAGYETNKYPLDATNPKIFWSIEDVIASTGWLPIEINVPDTISSISSGISGITGNILQRIPIINRITNPVKPRPFQYALIPVKIMTAPAQEQIRYDPFDSHSNHFPTFP